MLVVEKGVESSRVRVGVRVQCVVVPCALAVAWLKMGRSGLQVWGMA
jgi:hypothetical protein